MDTPTGSTLGGRSRVLVDTDVRLGEAASVIHEPPDDERRKFYYDGGQVEIAAHLVYELDPDGKELRVVHYALEFA